MKEVENVEQFYETIKNGVTLVDCFATWCAPCRMIAPFIEEISEEYKDKINVLKLDVDEYPEIANKYSIRAIPTLLVFKDDNLVKTNVGFLPKDDIASLVDEVLSK